MNILVLNCGSSSVKYKLYEMETHRRIAKGQVERVGLLHGVMKHSAEGKDPVVLEEDFPDHMCAVQKIIDTLVHPEHGLFSSKEEIQGIGHRVVHGGENFQESVLVDENVIEGIKKCSGFAPLHNPANLTGIEACRKLLSGIPNVAVFDTAFHSKMPRKAYIYPIDYDYYKKLGVRRYGFHGTSHYYVSRRASEILGLDRPAKIITVHLGNGSSITAVKEGWGVDTSMGFTPLEGLPMGTRSGDIDTAIVFYLMEHDGLNCDEVNGILQKKSG
ncbi:MAG: acetate/propionate family kinase, partial [Fibrobacterota bacterium]